MVLNAIDSMIWREKKNFKAVMKISFLKKKYGGKLDNKALKWNIYFFLLKNN